MRNVLAFTILMVFGAIASADEWMTPTETDYPSANGKYVAHVTPAKDTQKPQLDVFELRGTERVPLWSCDLANAVAPVQVYASDDGRCVVTCNEWHRVGYGDYVLAFYGKQGLIANYSMEQVLHLSADMEPVDLWRRIPHSASSRWWDENSIKFFDSQAGAARFCIWVHLFDRWSIWDSQTGREVVADSAMAERYNAQARRWSLEQIEAHQGGDCPYEFLGKLRNPQDRPVIESLLSDARFGGLSRRGVLSPPSDPDAKERLLLYETYSHNRSLGERILSEWNQADGLADRPRLGRVEGVVNLPSTAYPREATLWVYLVPATVAKDQWHTAASVQRLVAPFSEYSFSRMEPAYAETFPFAISTVEPGQYWVKAVLDKTPPLTERTNSFCKPVPGDYENQDLPTVTVAAGQTANVSIDCTAVVGDRVD